MNGNRGITLLEMLFVIALSTMLALMTMRALAVSRGVGGKARERARVALLAQRELDAVLAANSVSALPSEWLVDCPGPPTTATLTLAQRGSRLTEVRVALRREDSDGPIEVALTTIAEVAR